MAAGIGNPLQDALDHANFCRHHFERAQRMHSWLYMVASAGDVYKSHGWITVVSGEICSSAHDADWIGSASQPATPDFAVA